MANELTAGLPPVHPGSILREDVIPALGKSKAAVARLLGISRRTLYDILDEEAPISVPMALRVGKLCGNGARIWLAMQQEYDLRTAELAMAAELAAIPTLEEEI